MYRSVSGLEKDVNEKLAAHDLDAALCLIIRFVEDVIRDDLATARVFGSATLDALCESIGAKALEDYRITHDNKKPRGRDSVVFIATALFNTGGHTAIIEDLIKARQEKNHHILLTDLYDSADCSSVPDRFAPLMVKVECAPSGSAVGKLRWLQRRLIEISPYQVVLVSNHPDAVAVSAIQPAMETQAIFYHHGDHHLCLGVYLKDALHVDPHNIGFDNCRNQLGVANNRYWPLVVHDQGIRPPSIPFLEDGALRTCSSGHRSKFEHPYLYVYGDEVPKILAATGGVHIHIGELSQATLDTIWRGMDSSGIARDRFILIPWVKSLWLAMIEHKVDLYVGSFPLGGGRASVEVMGAGIPMVIHQGYASRFHGGADVAYPEAFCWRTPGELHRYMQGLTAEYLATQAVNARRHYERYHTSDKLNKELTRIDEETLGLRPEPLREYRPDALQIYLDQVNCGFAYWSNRLDKKEQEVHGLQATIQTQQQELDRIHASLGWRLLSWVGRIRDRMLPIRTRRRKVCDIVVRSVKRIRKEGWRSYWKRCKKEAIRFYVAKTSYRKWIAKNEPGKAGLDAMRVASRTWSYRPKVSIVTPVYNPNRYDLTQCIQSVLDQTYENWELCLVDGASDKPYVKDVIKSFADREPRIKYAVLAKNHGIAGNSNEALKLASGEYVGLLDHDDMLAPFALHEVVKLLNASPDVDFLYSDEDKVPPEGGKRYDPAFKPDWSPDTFLSGNYACHFSVVRKRILDDIGWFREGYDGSQDYDLILRIVQKTSHIRRIPNILYHWRASRASVASDPQAKPYAYVAAKKAINEYLANQGLQGEVVDGLFTGGYRVKYRVRPFQTVCIIIPTRDQVHLLKQCVSSVLDKTDYQHFKVLIVDNGSREPETHEFFSAVQRDRRVNVLRDDRPFNFSAINNRAAGSADSEHLVFLNNDTEVISREWLSAMLEFAQRKDVGAVGARLYFTDRTIQHAGVILGLGGVAAHSHRDFPDSSHGYMGRIKIIQNLSAVTAACMMVRREVFEEVGGFDESLAHAFNDVDLCLKMREKGYLIVYTPYAELYHHESASRGHEDTPERKVRFAKEVEIMKGRWKHVLEAGDPYYNPNLTLDKPDFSIRL